MERLALLRSFHRFLRPCLPHTLSLALVLSSSFILLPCYPFYFPFLSTPFLNRIGILSNMDSIKQAATQFILTPEYHDLLSIVKGFRNGLVYGAKIRFPHALVMTLLFRRSNFKDMAHFVLKATKQHARNLAFFATIYKTLLIVQRRMHGKERPLDSFLAGLVGGYMVFGENNNVNQQIVLYLFSRIMMGLAKLPVKKNVIAEPTQTFPIFASLVWATVMFLFQNERDVLQPSLQASMQYIYIDSNRWNTLKNFLWHNK